MTNTTRSNSNTVRLELLCYIRPTISRPNASSVRLRVISDMIERFQADQWSTKDT